MPAAAVLLLLAAAYAYYLACQIWPYTDCHTCHGTGKRRSPNRAGFRPCRRCQGSGTRRRLLARNRNH